MFSLNDLFAIRSARESRATFQNLNLNDTSQLGTAAAGALLVLTGSLFRRSLLGVGITLGGAAVLFHALTRSGAVNRGPGAQARRTRRRRQAKAAQTMRYSDSAGVPGNEGCKLVRSIRIDAPRQDIFNFLRNVENAPQYVKGIESVQLLDDRRSHWIAQTPAGESTEWYLEIFSEHPGEMIAWQSLEGSDLQHAGSIRLESCPDGSTEIKVAMEYHLLGLGFGEAVADAIGEGMENQLIQDLGRLKFLLESAERDRTEDSKEITL